MSCEQSYRAILRYLTDEREPYAPGTPGNTKRKIRKAAACYVVRDGTLFYQRRLKGHNDFTELEVVLQDGRRTELIQEAHVLTTELSQEAHGAAGAGGGGEEHLNQQLTWESISQKYWWRGILKHVKDYIRECPQCQSRRGTIDDGTRTLNRPVRRRANEEEDEEDEEEEEEEGDEGLVFDSTKSRPSKTAKHELVFVDSQGEVQQFLPRHSQTILERLNQQRLTNQFCDITLLIEGEEHRAHKAVLAASSHYFNQLFYEKGAASTHEAVVDLSGFTKVSFLPLLDFAYTSSLRFNFCVMADVANLARHLLMEEVLHICESVHKQVEEQRLTVYQKGDVHTVVGSQINAEAAAPDQDAIATAVAAAGGGGAFVVTIGSDGRALVTQETDSLTFVSPPDDAAADKVQEAEPPVSDTPHTCSECGASFPRRYALIMHTVKHEKARGYKCSLCSKEFQYAASLRAHLARHKQQSSQRAAIAKPPPPPPSSDPDGEPKPDGDLDETPASPLTKREFVCDICGKTLPKLYSLRIHMLNHTGVRPHACKVCNKTFAHKHGLKTHRALHAAAKTFTCCYCSKTFGSKRSMEEHTSLHTGESKYLCNTCGATFHRASALSKHLKKHLPKPDVRPFGCSHCDKRFFESKDLQQHMNKHMGLKPFQCQVCGKCYSWKKDWYSHVKSHSVAEPFKCNVCGKEFFEKALFRRHVKKATHGKKGRVKQNLERECEQCGRKFTQLREYRRHVNNHQGVKPFECLTCGVAWADARSLKRHVRTHTGERPYVCPMCQEAHIDARTLRKHMAKYHGDNLPGKIMLEKDTLQFHNQGTQVEHAVSILASELPPELRPPQQPAAAEEIETVLITEETVEAMEAAEAVQAVGEGAVATLSDQGIMQVVNYVLAQQALTDTKLEDEPQVLHTMEVEVAHVAEVAHEVAHEGEVAHMAVVTHEVTHEEAQEVTHEGEVAHMAVVTHEVVQEEAQEAEVAHMAEVAQEVAHQEAQEMTQEVVHEVVQEVVQEAEVAHMPEVVHEVTHVAEVAEVAHMAEVE